MPSSSSSNAPIPSGLIPRKPTGRPAPDDGTVTLIGVVDQGVESRSIVLFDDVGNPLAQLSGRPAGTYPFGARVQVTGRFVPELRTTAQQGRPFRVEDLAVL